MFQEKLQYHDLLIIGDRILLLEDEVFFLVEEVPVS
jgi:hypothetical protein